MALDSPIVQTLQEGAPAVEVLEVARPQGFVPMGREVGNGNRQEHTGVILHHPTLFRVVGPEWPSYATRARARARARCKPRLSQVALGRVWVYSHLSP